MAGAFFFLVSLRTLTKETTEMNKREVVISRFELGGRGFYFHTIWQGNEFSLTLTDGKYAWQGHGNQIFCNRLTPPSNQPICWKYPQAQRDAHCWLPSLNQGSSDQTRHRKETVLLQSPTRYFASNSTNGPQAVIPTRWSLCGTLSWTLDSLTLLIFPWKYTKFVRWQRLTDTREPWLSTE